MDKLLPDFRVFDIQDCLLPFSKVRLVALDLDGTLLKSNEALPPKKIVEFARKLNIPKHDVRLTIATGRTFNGARDLIDSLAIRKDTPIILYNGNVILNKKFELLAQYTISNECLQRIVTFLSTFEVKLLAYCFEHFQDDHPVEYAFGWSSSDMPLLEYNKMEVHWMSWKDTVDRVCPSAIVIHTDGNSECTKAIIEELDRFDEIYYTLGKTYIEVGSKNSNKGKALEFSANFLGLQRDQVLAIGDNDNDAEMLSWAGIGVAMQSGSELARENSDFVTKTGVITGVVEVMNLIYSARRLLSAGVYANIND